MTSLSLSLLQCVGSLPIFTHTLSLSFSLPLSFKIGLPQILPPRSKLIWKRVQKADALTGAAGVFSQTGRFVECLRGSRLTNFGARHGEQVVVHDVLERVRQSSGWGHGGRGQSGPDCHPAMLWSLHDLAGRRRHELIVVAEVQMFVFSSKLSFYFDMHSQAKITG
jgi:hypothetical protein